MKLLAAIFPSLLLLHNVVAELTVTPPPNAYLSPGSASSDLVCKAASISSSPLTSCSWVSPNGQILNLAKGLRALGGRIAHRGEPDQGECGIKIENFDAETDQGTWRCILGVTKGDLVVSAEGRVSVSSARAPSSVRLSAPFDRDVANITKDDDAQDVSCVAHEAQPRPKFTWIIGDEKLEGYQVEDSEIDDAWVQTLKYVPDWSHADSVLTCVVEGDFNTTSSSSSPGVVLRFIGKASSNEEDGEDGTAQYDEGESGATNDTSLSFYATVGVLAAGLFLTAAAAVLARNFAGRFLCCRKEADNLNKSKDIEAGDEKKLVEGDDEIDDSKKNGKDEEKAAEGHKEEETKKDGDDKKKDEDNADSESVKSLGARIVALFRCKREITDKKDEESPSDKDAKESAEEVKEEGEEKKTEAAQSKPEENTEEVEEQEETPANKKSGNFFSKMRNRFFKNRNSKEADPEAIGMENANKEGDEKKVDEMENADKEGDEKKVAEVETEKDKVTEEVKTEKDETSEQPTKAVKNTDV